MKTKFYFCPLCGNLIMKVDGKGPTPICCGQEMIALEPNTTDAALEKHVPAYEWVNSHCLRVQVGSTLHPMLKDHHISFIFLETRTGGQLRYICPEEKPVVEFCCRKSDVVAVYEYCNIHGLWKKDVPPDKEDAMLACSSYF